MSVQSSVNPQSLLAAARDNQPDTIRTLVQDFGVPVEWANPIGQTALHVACLHGNVEAAEELLELGTDVNILNSRGTSPLHFAAAAHKNALETCQLLLNRGADTGISDNSGRLPYEMAENPEIRLLLGGPDPRLFQYAAAGNLEGLRALFAEDPETEPAVFDADGMAPIHLAAQRGHMGVVNFLLERGTYLDMQDHRGNTAAHHAVREGHGGVLTLLLRKGADLSIQNFNSSEYAQGSWLSAGEVLLPLHQTPLHIAVEQGDASLAKQLLAGGAPVNALDFDKKTALHAALEMQDEECAEVLLEHGADPNQGSKDFATPLHLVAPRGMQPLLELLLSKGADPNAADEQGWTPLMLAVRAGKQQAVRALLEAGADAAAKNGTQGSTSVHLAAVNGKVEICKLLAQRCPKALGVRNAAGAVPAEVAKTAEVAAALAVPMGGQAVL